MVSFISSGMVVCHPNVYHALYRLSGSAVEIRLTIIGGRYVGTIRIKLTAYILDVTVEILFAPRFIYQE